MLKFVFRDEWAVAWLLSVRGRQAGMQAGRQAVGNGLVALFAARASQTWHDSYSPDIWRITLFYRLPHIFIPGIFNVCVKGWITLNVRSGRRADRFNLYTPNVNYNWRNAPLTSKVAFYIFIQQIQVLNILNTVYTLNFLSSSKCSLFHKSNVFGSFIIHILFIYSTNIGTEYFKHGI